MELIQLLHDIRTIYTNKRGSITKATRHESTYPSYLKVQKLDREAGLKTIGRLFSFRENNKQYLVNKDANEEKN